MAFLKEGLDAKGDGVFVGNQVGDAPQAIAGAAKKFEAVFYSPYQNHVCMELVTGAYGVLLNNCGAPGAKDNVIETTEAGPKSVAYAITKVLPLGVGRSEGHYCDDLPV